MVQAQIANIYNETQTGPDGTPVEYPAVVIVYFDDSLGTMDDVVAQLGTATYMLRKDSGIETMEDVLAFTRGEIDRLGRTDVVGTRVDDLGNKVDILERDTIVAGSNVEATPDKNFQVSIDDVKGHEGYTISLDTPLDSLSADVVEG